MIHKLLAGKGRMKKAVSLLLCLALLGSSVISTNVAAAETGTDLVVTTEADSSSDATNSDETLNEEMAATTEITTEMLTSTEAQITESTEAISEAATEAVTEAATEVVTESVTEGANGATVSSGKVTETDEATATTESKTEESTESVASAAETVQAMIDALPSVEELSTMTTEEQLEVYYAALAADEAYQALSDEDKESVDDYLLDELFAYFNGQTTTTATYSGEYSVQAGSSISVGSQTTGSGPSRKNLTISNYTITASSGSTDGVTITESSSGWESTDTTSLTVTGVTAETVVTIDVTYSDGSTGTYTVTVTGRTYSQHIDVRLVTDDFEFTQTITESSTQKITVTKVWEDEDSVDHSSDSVTVYLTNSSGEKVTDSDGNYYTAVLSESNGWTAAWEGLTLNAGDYSVVEDAISGYSSSETSVTVGEAGSATETVTVKGSLELTGISTTLTYTHNGTTYTTTGYTDGTDTLNGKTVKEYHFANNATASGSTQGTQIALSDGDTITVVVTFKATYTVYDSEGNVIASATNKEFTDYTYTETVASGNNYCSGGGYDFYVYPEELLESIISEETKTITVTNTPSTATLTLEKQIESNAVESTKTFEITVSYTDENGNTATQTYYFADGESNADNPLIVQLGSTVTITEDNGNCTVSATVNGEDADITGDSENTISFTVTDDTAVVVTNTYYVYPDTGVNLDSAPYIALLCGVVVLGAVVLIRRRRKLL